ncbi:MAG: hypothetical protein F6K41_28790 [Symploca sp. SIO3E6]|nr:hypothetical protein [Caldora sp. SIO3E6]
MAYTLMQQTLITASEPLKKIETAKADLTSSLNDFIGFGVASWVIKTLIRRKTRLFFTLSVLDKSLDIQEVQPLLLPRQLSSGA